MRFAFFLLLIFNAALGAHLWLSEAKSAGEDPRKREINADALKIIAVSDARSAASTAARVTAAKQLAESITPGACVELSGVKVADASRVQQSLGELNLGDRLGERRNEEPSRWWVFVAPASNRSTAEANMAALKRQGIRDVALQPDNALSLGLFSSDEAATRYLAEVQGKGARSAQKAPRAMQVKEHIFTVREPDTTLVARLTLLQADLEGSALKAVACPGMTPSAASAPAGKS
jgi:hypothetical protein